LSKLFSRSVPIQFSLSKSLTGRWTLRSRHCPLPEGSRFFNLSGKNLPSMRRRADREMKILARRQESSPKALLPSEQELIGSPRKAFPEPRWKETRHRRMTSVSEKSNTWPRVARLARKLFNPPTKMKMHASQPLTKPQSLRTTPAPLMQLFSTQLAPHADPPAVRAAWLRLFWEIVRKPKRSHHHKH